MAPGDAVWEQWATGKGALFHCRLRTLNHSRLLRWLRGQLQAQWLSYVPSQGSMR